MARIYGLFGAMRGKVADVVMSVRNGQQIVRKYQPVVKNPQTENQNAARARFKLLSQLSSVLNEAIAFRRSAGVSSRNKFTAANFPATTFSDNRANINMLAVDLTGGVRRLPPIHVENRTAPVVNFSLYEDAKDYLDGVVYAIVTEGSDGLLGLHSVDLVSTPGEGGSFPGSKLVSSNLHGYVLAYGVTFADAAAKTKFANLLAAENVAYVSVLRSLSEDILSLTETQGAVFTASSSSKVGVEEKTKKK